MAGLSISGQMKVSTLQKGFLKEFGLTLRVYDGREFADPTQTLAQVRKKKGSGKGLSVAKNMKVGNLEDKFEEEFGLKVQVAGSDDSYLCKNELTLNAAQQEDEKKLARKEQKAARQNEAGDNGDKKDGNKKRKKMTILTFAYNEDTHNTEIEILDEDLDVKNATLKIVYLKSFDDEDYYEFDINENEYEISNLQLKSNGDDCYEVLFNAEIKVSDEKWQNADENFKKNAESGFIEVEFDLESNGTIYEDGEHFEKQSDGQTELFID